MANQQKNGEKFVIGRNIHNPQGNRIQGLEYNERTVVEGTYRKQLAWYGYVSKMEDRKVPKTLMNFESVEGK